jgi:type IX secretion system PorP/SprF family membrane protein
MSAIKRFLLILFLVFSFYVSDGQQTPLNPVSYRVFSPFVFNPAIAGSKDFFSFDLVAGTENNSKSQIISINTRLPKKSQDYISSPGATEFTKIGIGGILFNDMNGVSRNIGVGTTLSYHIQLGKKALSFLSLGTSFKAIYNINSGNSDLSIPAKNTFLPNLDVGVYFYNPSFYAGISTTNLLGNPEHPDSLGIYSIPVSQQFFFQIGYRFVLNRSLNILLEPSVVVNTDNSFSQKLKNMIEPALKLYADNFCVGTYFNDFSKISFFLQYKFPRFYVGTYFELPNNSAFYKKSLRTELSLGINFSGIKSGVSRFYHW